MKHIDTVFLWVQAMVTEDKISLGKKHAATMQSCMAGLVMKSQSGENKVTVKTWRRADGDMLMDIWNEVNLIFSMILGDALVSVSE